MTPDQKQALDMRDRGCSRSEIAEAMGKSKQAVKSLLWRGRKWREAPKGIINGSSAIGADTPASAVWTKTHKDGSITYSVLHSKDKDEDEDGIINGLIESLLEYTPLDERLFAPRINHGDNGEHLAIVDIADIHFGKLCEMNETNNKYNLDAARHRAVEGTRSLLRDASGIGIGRILFVLGNDILHTDNGKTTTKNTPQDTDGTFFSAWKAAEYASIDAIGQCAAVANTDLLHCMSNHDWRSGWALSQTVAAAMRGHSRVRASDYNMSERHRKFYGFENNAFMLTHGDGSKEESLYGHFVQEARNLVANCDNLYALLHHIHHKITNRRGVDVFQCERDHNGMTAIMTGAPQPQRSHVGIEYVRSPSPPDGWHDRNGYLNRQGVECFIYHPHDGQKHRLTEWF